MNVIDILKEVKDSEKPYQEAMALDPMFWVKYVRRQDANIIDTLFLDKDKDISNDDVLETIKQVAEFFELPIPVIIEKVETIAEVITSENAAECELHYNLQDMENSGLNNREAMKLAFLHELAHQYLYKVRFMLFENELWVHELAADLLVGAYSILNGDMATGKYKYVVSAQKATITHPDGKFRKEIVEYGRKYVEQLLEENRFYGIKYILNGLHLLFLYETAKIQNQIRSLLKTLQRTKYQLFQRTLSVFNGTVMRRILSFLFALAISLVAMANSYFYIDSVVVQPDQWGTVLRVPIKAHFDARVQEASIYLSYSTELTLDHYEYGRDFF